MVPERADHITSAYSRRVRMTIEIAVLAASLLALGASVLVLFRRARSRREEHAGAIAALSKRLDAERARVDELREATRALETSRAAADAASRAKDEFLAMLAHELRNPLAPILTALELMRSQPDLPNE